MRRFVLGGVSPQGISKSQQYLPRKRKFHIHRTTFGRVNFSVRMIFRLRLVLVLTFSFSFRSFGKFEEILPRGRLPQRNLQCAAISAREEGNFTSIAQLLVRLVNFAVRVVFRLGVFLVLSFRFSLLLVFLALVLTFSYSGRLVSVKTRFS